MAGVLRAVLCVLAVLAAPAAASAASLYTGGGHRPGPDILYAPAAVAPQLQNSGVWRAAPILVSGATAYRGGEFLYQDYLYDDHGAQEQYDPNDPRANGNLFSKPDGTYTYPTNPAYANDAADLVELRVKPLADSTALRLTFNTMKDPSLIAFTIAIGGTPGASLPFPAGANVRAPADLFLTVHPAGGRMVADLVHAAGLAPAGGPAPSVTVDTTHRQIEVRVPHAAWDPGRSTVRLAAGAGLWDAAAGRYLTPQSSADGSHPGGAGSAPNPPAFFNVAFRTNEPSPSIGDIANTAQSPAWWRDKEQGQALASGDISELHADIDFGKLASGRDDETGVPQTGPLDRILASHFEPAQGADFSVNCLSGAATCVGAYQGNLQPYAIYVPRKPRPAGGYGLTLLLHALSTNYNLFEGSRNQSQFGERGPGSIVITPEARGPDGSYYSYAGADVFEVWADVARHYALDPDWTAMGGYSMGGLGTYKLADDFPDLFAKVQPTVGADATVYRLPTLRNIPILSWDGQTDELDNPAFYEATAASLFNLGYRFEEDVFLPGEHNSIAINDQYAPAADFLGTEKVDRDPFHVTFVRDPSVDVPKLGYVADHAYWLSGVRIRSNATTQFGLNGPASPGTIDAVSHGFGEADPPASGPQPGAGVLTGGNLGTLPFSRKYETWGPVPPAPRADAIDLNAQNVATVTIDAPRAHVDCAAKVNVKSDGPLAVTLTDCGGLPAARSCLDTRKFSFRLHHARGARVVRVVVYVNGRRKLSRRGHSISRITLRRLPHGLFTVKVVATQSTGSKLVSSRVYRGCTKSRPRTRGHRHRR